MITEAETKEIEKEAKAHALQNEAARYFELKPTLRNIALQCSNESYIAGATAIAEKKNVEAESRERLLEEYSSALLSLRKKNDVNLAQLEAAQEELEKAYKEYHKVVDSEQALQAELERVKAVAEKMAKALETMKNVWMFKSDKSFYHPTEVSEALTEFANLMNKEK